MGKPLPFTTSLLEWPIVDAPSGSRETWLKRNADTLRIVDLRPIAILTRSPRSWSRPAALTNKQNKKNKTVFQYLLIFLYQKLTETNCVHFFFICSIKNRLINLHF